MPTKSESSANPQGPSVSRNIITFLACLGIVVALWVIVQLKSLAVLAVISVVLTTGLDPIVAWLERHKIPRIGAIAIVYVMGFIVLSGAFTLVLVPLIQQAIEFSKNLPDYLDAAEKWLGQIHQRYPQVPDYANIINRAQSQLSEMGQYVTGSIGAVFGIFGGVVSVFTVMVFTFYMLLMVNDIRTNVLMLIPKAKQAKARKTMSRMVGAMGGWLRGTLLLSIIVGTAISIVMLAMGVPYAYVIGVVGAIGEPIPMVGPLAAAIVAVIITAFGPIWKLFAVVIFFIVLSVVESYMLAPKIMQKQVGLSPLTTIVALAAGGALLGIVGALLAIPVAAALRVLYFDVVVPGVNSRKAAKSSQ